ncbi:hypothetical protein NPIL_474781, partial [Nephila pilipes]
GLGRRRAPQPPLPARPSLVLSALQFGGEQARSDPHQGQVST